jgi:large subunit ribosomal protein L24
MRIKTGDLVEVIAGNYKGQRGEVQRIVRGKLKYGRKKGQLDPASDRVVVSGVNIIKKTPTAYGTCTNPNWYY